MTREELLQISKPILFNTEMVRAILDGIKTETRRIAKGVPQNVYRVEPVDIFEDGTMPLWDFLYGVPLAGGGRAEMFETIKAPYKTGDYLYVRETWGIGNDFCNDNDEPNLCVCYKASNGMENYITFKINEEEYEKFSDLAAERLQWFPSIHMPKEAARIFLRVTGVKVERLHDITGSECVKEGIPESSLLEMGDEFTIGQFHDLWDSTIKPKDRDKYGWEANPWVWVIEFEKVEVEF